MRRAWSQEHLARAAGLGLRTIQRIESSGVASFESTLAIAGAFDVPVDELTINLRRIRWPWKRLGPALVIAASLVAALITTRFAMADQYRVDVGVNINGSDQDSQAVVVAGGEQATLGFDEQLKAVIKPSVVNVNGRERVSVSLQVYERGNNEHYQLLESSELVHEDGGSWEIRISGTPSGKSYRLVVRSQLVSS